MRLIFLLFLLRFCSFGCPCCLCRRRRRRPRRRRCCGSGGAGGGGGSLQRTVPQLPGNHRVARSSREAARGAKPRHPRSATKARQT